MLSIVRALSSSKSDFPSILKATNLQGKLQKDSVHFNRRKQFFNYDDTLNHLTALSGKSQAE